MGNFWTKAAKWSLLDKETDKDWANKRNWICNDQFCPNPYTHARGDPCKLTMEDPFLSLAGVRFSTHLRKVLVAPTILMEDQDSEEYCEVTALAEEMMRPSGSHHE